MWLWALSVETVPWHWLRGCCRVGCAVAGQELFEWLKAFGWRGEPARLRAICQVLITNDFKRWYQLGRASDPAGWVDAAVLDEVELSFLRSFMERGKQVPR